MIVRNGSVASSTSTPSVVRRAKVKASALQTNAMMKRNALVAISALPRPRVSSVPLFPNTSTSQHKKVTKVDAFGVATYLAERRGSNIPTRQILSTTPHNFPVPNWIQSLQAQETGSEYDDSTITTKDASVMNKRAIIDTSRVPEDERADYMEAAGVQKIHFHTLHARRKESTADFVDFSCSKHSSERKVLAEQSDDGLFNELEEQVELEQTIETKHEKHVEFGGTYPEPTRRGDRVPELISPMRYATANPMTVVSDISSLRSPKSKDDAFFDGNSTMNGYGGFTVEDNITGFLDKMVFSIRRAIFDSNGCK
ncbi:MAG: hypothetical protein SGILL_001831 [Bacillariaceae sp.]